MKSCLHPNNYITETELYAKFADKIYNIIVYSDYLNQLNITYYMSFTVLVVGNGR